MVTAIGAAMIGCIGIVASTRSGSVRSGAKRSVPKRRENEGGRKREMTNLERLAKKVGERHPKAEMVPVAAASGLVREAAEYFHLADSWAHDGHIYHEGAAIVELGDVLHYLVLACLEHQITLEELARVNLIKIDARAKGEERAYNQAMDNVADGQIDLEDALDELETALAVPR